MTKPQAVLTLDQHIQQLEAMEHRPGMVLAFARWKTSTQSALRNIFGDQASSGADFVSIHDQIEALDTLIRYSENAPGFPPDYHDMVADLVRCLRGLQAEVDTYWNDDHTNGTNLAVSQPDKPKTMTKDVFIVHGDDGELKESVARLLTRLGLNPIILHEQADRGRTFIEKFNAHGDVAFAIALFTPDDVGASKGQSDSLKPRARQNVVFEMGYFVGKLDRGQAVALVRGDVELPSDWQGVQFIQVDGGGAWRFQLAGELRAAGFDIDANRLFN